MCVAFNPETVYKNAFFTNKGSSPISKLMKSDIANFCNIIEEEVMKNFVINNIYEYVYFDFNKQTLSSFYEAYFGIFSEIGDVIFLNEKLSPEDIYEVNKIYDKQIKESLKDARRRFQECIVAK